MARRELLSLLQKMVVVDETIYVQSHDKEETWTDDKTFPSNEKFTEALEMRQDTANTEKVTMAMCLSPVYQKTWKDIKFSETVLNHVKKTNVYIFVDEFKTKKVGSPGFITIIHLRLANLKQVKETIVEGLERVECDEEKIVEQWKEKNQDVEDMGNKIPHFAIFLQSKKWGQPPLPIEAMVISIQCAVEDTAYIKTLLSEASNKELIKVGTYVPQGLFRMAGEEVYKHHLQAHNDYVASITAVAIVGMHKDA
eukprot:6738983-Ditylum_brightwellii.AAC.1